MVNGLSNSFRFWLNSITILLVILCGALIYAPKNYQQAVLEKWQIIFVAMPFLGIGIIQVWLLCDSWRANRPTSMLVKLNRIAQLIFLLLYILLVTVVTIRFGFL